MLALVRRYEVERDQRSAFEAAFGPAGDWARAFSQSSDYRGIELFRADDAYLVLCVWDSKPAFEAFVQAHAAEVDRLNGDTGRLTRCSHALGEYEVLETA